MGSPSCGRGTPTGASRDFFCPMSPGSRGPGRAARGEEGACTAAWGQARGPRMRGPRGGPVPAAAPARLRSPARRAPARMEADADAADPGPGCYQEENPRAAPPRVAPLVRHRSTPAARLLQKVWDAAKHVRKCRKRHRLRIRAGNYWGRGRNRFVIHLPTRLCFPPHSSVITECAVVLPTLMIFSVILKVDPLGL